MWKETGTSKQEVFQIGIQADRVRQWCSDDELCIVVKYEGIFIPDAWSTTVPTKRCYNI